MRLYHLYAWGVLILIFALVGCSSPVATQASIGVQIIADEETISLRLSAGSTVQQALQQAGITLGSLDRVDPPSYTLLSDGVSVRVIRVREEFEVEEEVVPFERQLLQSESLPENERLLVQNGVNGLKEITYRLVYEDGREVSRSAVKVVTVREAVPEIVMVGIRTPFIPLAIPGKLVYLLGGNAWLMEASTANRRPLINSGDLDGRIFSLSSDGNWLLYTRRSAEEGQINSLWVADLRQSPVKEIDLGVANVVHFADWVPGSTSKVVFSTVEPRSAAPGWQANNDLNVLSFSPSGWVSNWRSKPVLEANSGGVYGWWGTNFAWAPDGQLLAFTRPDSIGLLNYKDGTMTTLMEIVPFQTREDWAWVPGIAWGADGSVLYAVSHAPPEDSQIFDLMAIPVSGGVPIRLNKEVGMFAYPVTSPMQPQATGELAYQVAFLQASFPRQSDTSPYRLAVMDRDGSNLSILFPTSGEAGLEPQQVVWSPAELDEESGHVIAVLYKGNVWFVSARDGKAQQVTGDGLIKRITWK